MLMVRCSIAAVSWLSLAGLAEAECLKIDEVVKSLRSVIESAEPLSADGLKAIWPAPLVRSGSAGSGLALAWSGDSAQPSTCCGFHLRLRRHRVGPSFCLLPRPHAGCIAAGGGAGRRSRPTAECCRGGGLEHEWLGALDGRQAVPRDRDRRRRDRAPRHCVLDAGGAPLESSKAVRQLVARRTQGPCRLEDDPCAGYCAAGSRCFSASSIRPRKVSAAWPSGTST